MISKKLSLLAIAAVLLAGCTMIPKYARPEAPVPAGWPNGPAYRESRSAQGARLPPDLQWREFFADERLQTIIGTALKNNRDLRVAALNVEKARALYRIQRAELLPVVGATGSGIKERAVENFFAPRIAGDGGTVQRQSGRQLPGRSTFSAASAAWKNGRLRNTSPRTGPPQRADPAGVRSRQRLSDACRGSGKSRTGPIDPRGPAASYNLIRRRS